MATKTRHTDGKVGGYLIGRRHSAGGIQAVNTDTNTPLELETDEVIITRRAVLSDDRHAFDGEQLTNLEILSRINEQGGGVSLLADGGQVGPSYRCRCSGGQHLYHGKQYSDRQVLEMIRRGDLDANQETTLQRLEAIQAMLPFSRGNARAELLRQQQIAKTNYKSISYG